jgi:hypothetical protein
VYRIAHSLALAIVIDAPAVDTFLTASPSAVTNATTPSATANIDAGARALARARVIAAARRIYGIDEYGIYRDAELTPNIHDPYHLLYAILLKIYSWLITL